MRTVRPLAGLAVAVTIWWGCVAGLNIRPFFLPGPLDVADALAGNTGYLLHQTAVTAGQLGAGFGIAAVAAVVVAVMLAAVNWVRESVLPLLVAVQGVPKVAIAPLLVVWLGFGPASKITLVVALSFFPVLVATLAGLSSTPMELVDLARSLRASRWRMFWAIRLPHALPQVFTGLKVAIMLALIGTVVAQFSVPDAGLGAVIVRASHAANTPMAFAAFVLLAAIGVGAFYLLVAVERVTLPWARNTTA